MEVLCGEFLIHFFVPCPCKDRLKKSSHIRFIWQKSDIFICKKNKYHNLYTFINIKVKANTECTLAVSSLGYTSLQNIVACSCSIVVNCIDGINSYIWFQKLSNIAYQELNIPRVNMLLGLFFTNRDGSRFISDSVMPLFKQLFLYLVYFDILTLVFVPCEFDIIIFNLLDLKESKAYILPL